MLILMRIINLLQVASAISIIFFSAQSSHTAPVNSRYLLTCLRAEAIQMEALARQQGLRQLSVGELIGTMTLFYRSVSAR